VPARVRRITKIVQRTPPIGRRLSCCSQAPPETRDSPRATPAGERIAPNAARVFFCPVVFARQPRSHHICTDKHSGLRTIRQHFPFHREPGPVDLYGQAPHHFFCLDARSLEMATGILILSRGRLVKLGLAARVSFNLFLLQLGLGWPAIPGTRSDFLHNRLPNLLFALLQLPLFGVRFTRASLNDCLSANPDRSHR